MKTITRLFKFAMRRVVKPIIKLLQFVVLFIVFAPIWLYSKVTGKRMPNWIA